MRGDFHLSLLSAPAQKHIDNVLDIKDDEVTETSSDDPKMTKSRTMPSIAEAGRKKEPSEQDSWGSFNGSFFESKPTPASPITNPPPRHLDTVLTTVDIEIMVVSGYG